MTAKKKSVKPSKEDTVRINRIKGAMGDAGKSRTEVAKHMNVSEATVSSWCSNASQPHLTDMLKLSKFLGVGMCALLGDKVK